MAIFVSHRPSLKFNYFGCPAKADCGRKNTCTAHGTKAAGQDLFSIAVIIFENLGTIFNIKTKKYLNPVKFFWFIMGSGSVPENKSLKTKYSRFFDKT